MPIVSRQSSSDHKFTILELVHSSSLFFTAQSITFSGDRNLLIYFSRKSCVKGNENSTKRMTGWLVWNWFHCLRPEFERVSVPLVRPVCFWEMIRHENWVSFLLESEETLRTSKHQGAQSKLNLLSSGYKDKCAIHFVPLATWLVGLIFLSLEKFLLL